MSLYRLRWCGFRDNFMFVFSWGYLQQMKFASAPLKQYLKCRGFL
jgi:hypothetical protein